MLWLVDLAESTYIDWLKKLSNYSQLSDYIFADKLVKSTAVYAPITFEDIVMIVINSTVYVQVPGAILQFSFVYHLCF